MSLSDKRLLIELGTVMIIKIAALLLLKVSFFSPTPENIALPPLVGSVPDEEAQDSKSTYGVDKEH